MTDTETYTKNSGGGTFKSWFRGVAVTAMVGLLAWGGKTLWEVNAMLSTISEKISGVEKTVSEKITSVEAIVSHQADMSRKSETAQWRLIQEHTNDLGRLKAQIETLRYVQKEIVLPELQNPIPRRITIQIGKEDQTGVVVNSGVKQPAIGIRQKLEQWWIGDQAQAPVRQQEQRVDFKALDQKLKQIEQSDVYGQRAGAHKNLEDFTQDQIQMQEQAPVK